MYVHVYCTGTYSSVVPVPVCQKAVAIIINTGTRVHVLESMVIHVYRYYSTGIASIWPYCESRRVQCVLTRMAIPVAGTGTCINIAILQYPVASSGNIYIAVYKKQLVSYCNIPP